MRAASTLIHPTSYWNGYQHGIANVNRNNPYDVVSSKSKYDDWQTGYEDGINTFKKNQLLDFINEALNFGKKNGFAQEHGGGLNMTADGHSLSISYKGKLFNIKAEDISID